MLSILLTFALAAPIAPANPDQADGQPVVESGVIATLRQDSLTKLRKLHLVRPDLIPYPVATETYC